MNEEEATALLERLGQQVVVGPPPVEALTSAGRRRLRTRRSAQLAGVAGAAALAIGGGLLVAPDLGHRGPAATAPLTDGSTSPEPPGSTVMAGRPPSWQEMIGSWRPIRLLGRDVSGTRRMHGSPLMVSFSQKGDAKGWWGYDGCNWTSGHLHFTPGGAIASTGGATTQRGCLARSGEAFVVDTFTEVDAVSRATDVRLAGDQLLFYDADMRLLGVFLRMAGA